jgi:hypothetical protein
MPRPLSCPQLPERWRVAVNQPLGRFWQDQQWAFSTWEPHGYWQRVEHDADQTRSSEYRKRWE